MPPPPGKTLLSQWVKNAHLKDEDSHLDNEFRDNSNAVESIDRHRSAKLWEEIFRVKASHGGSDEPQSGIFQKKGSELDHEILSQSGSGAPVELETPRKRHKKHINPHNPFNSYVVTLKFTEEMDAQLQKYFEQKANLVRNETNTAADHISAKLSPNNEVPATSKFSKPSYIHTFKVSKELLKTIKPKLQQPQHQHSFFSKRNTSRALPSSFSTSKLTPVRLKSAPWRTIHIRPDITWRHAPIAKRDGVYGKKEEKDGHNCSILNDSAISKIHIPDQIHKAKRMLASSSQLNAMALHKQTKPNFETNKELIDEIGKPKPFDLGLFETKLWCEKYSPKSWKGHLTPDAAKRVYEWMSNQFDNRKHSEPKPKPARRYTGYSLDDGFVVDDDQYHKNDDDNDVLVVCGPTGSGKTSAVYAAARSYGAFVFEVSNAVKRTGKEISSMLDGISQNHAVHKAKNVVILLDDGDIVYENEAGGFWSAISRFAATSRRPVIITCTNPSLVALSSVTSQHIYFPAPDLVRVTNISWLVALSEGHILDHMKVAKLVVSYQGDLRKILMHLQFWCQMGIGGSPSSQEWLAKECEMQEHNADRVISRDSWFPDDMSNNDTGVLPGSFQKNRVCDDLTSIIVQDDCETDNMHKAAVTADFLSLHDTCPIPTATCTRKSPEETVWANGALPLSAWREPLILSYRGNEQALHNVYSMEVSYGTSSADIACDVSPYMRHMVASDFQRCIVMQQALANQTNREARMTRRTLAANGIDCRQYLELSQNSMTVVLNSGYPTEYITKLD